MESIKDTKLFIYLSTTFEKILLQDKISEKALSSIHIEKIRKKDTLSLSVDITFENTNQEEGKKK